MAVLSDQDIKKKLGKSILIYPIQERETFLRGACLCLTASEYVYSVDKGSLVKIIEDESGYFFQIEAQETVLVWTEESVALDAFHCGSIHSRVKLVSDGICNISTRVNPNWGGVLCLAFHNPSNRTIRVDTKSKSASKVKHAIAYLRFHTLTSKDSTPTNLDNPGRLDAISGNPIPDKLKEWLNDPGERWRRGDREVLKERLESDGKYQSIKRDAQKKSLRNKIFRFFRKLLPPGIAITLMGLYLLIEGRENLSDLILLIIPLSYTIVLESFGQNKNVE